MPLTADDVDLSKYRQSEKYPDPYDLYDDSGETKYLWCRGEDNSVYIWTETYYQEEKCVSDQDTAHLFSVKTDENSPWTRVFDGTFDAIAEEIKKLGFGQHCESCWSDSYDDDAGDPQKLIDFMEAHPRFKHCPEME